MHEDYYCTDFVIIFLIVVIFKKINTFLLFCLIFFVSII